LRIAQVAPLAESVPPRLYGGTERVVFWLTEALVAAGHEVTLFASGDSSTSARLVPACPSGLRLTGVRDGLASHLVMVDQVLRQADSFDMIHFHVDHYHFPLFRHIASKTVTTLHGRLDIPDYHPTYQAFPELPLVSISDNQRLPMPPGSNFAATVHHGMPADLLGFHRGSGGYLAFLGRISPEKRVDRAIEIAIAAGMPLKIAAKVDAVDQEYFEEEIAPLLDHPLVEFVGEIGDSQKREFLGNALALLFPIDWCEPFGLVMIEAMSVGTPVIAWPNGSVPEVIEEGRTGFVVDSIDAAAAAVEKARRVERRSVRAAFEERFTDHRMAADYVRVYNKVITGGYGQRLTANALVPATGDVLELPAVRDRPVTGVETIWGNEVDGCSQ
jgi:glycosyltransferase involved in cell wall biosynthesis